MFPLLHSSDPLSRSTLTDSNAVTSITAEQQVLALALLEALLSPSDDLNLPSAWHSTSLASA